MSRIRQYQSSMGLQSGGVLAPDTLCPQQPSRLSRLGPLIVFALGTLVAVHWLSDSLLQPTAVGLLWGTLFLLGCGAGSGLVGSLAESFGCGAIAYLCWLGAGRLCDIPLAENLVISAILGGNGWISGRWLHRFLDSLVHHRLADCRGASDHWRRGRQWSLADMLSLTTFVGCLTWGIPRLSAGAGLMTEVWLTLAATLLGSLIATAWVWTDHWSVRRLTILAALLMCLLAAVALGPVGDDWRLALAARSGGQAANAQGSPGLAAIREAILSPLYLPQVLTGPAAVVAVQSLSVLFMQAWWRWLSRCNRLTLHTLEPASGVKLCLASLD